MRNKQFKFKIEGDDVSPDTIPARDLFDIILNLEIAFAATAKSTGAKDDDDLSVSLVGVAKGSDLLTLAVSDRMLRAASKVSHAIADDDFSTLPKIANGKIRELWDKSRLTAWTFQFNSDGNGIVDAIISPSKEILKPGAISGRTTLHGVCERVGGAERQTLQLLLLTGERINVRVKGKDLAARIGGNLHKGIVGVNGEARWDIDTWKLSDFVVDGLTEYQECNPVEAFEALAVAAGSFWDNIDPEEYVSELRSD